MHIGGLVEGDEIKQRCLSAMVAGMQLIVFILSCILLDSGKILWLAFGIRGKGVKKEIVVRRSL